MEIKPLNQPVIDDFLSISGNTASADLLFLCISTLTDCKLGLILNTFKTNDMKTDNKKLLITFCFITLITACSNDPKIKSATEDTVVIGAPAENFLGAYDLAKKECDKNTRTVQYFSDDTTDLEVVTFNCIAQEEETVAEADTDTETEAEADTTEEDLEEEPVMEEESDLEMELEEETDMEIDTEETSAQ